MTYQAKSNNTLIFELTKDEKTIGKLAYKSWFKFSAEIDVLKAKYQIEPKGFWGTTVEVKDGSTLLLKFAMNWNGNIIIQTYFDGVEKDYIFQHKGFFRESLVLVDQKGTELLIMKPNFQWRAINYQYEITTTEIFETLEEKNILLLNTLHCANYFMAMMMGMGI